MSIAKEFRDFINRGSVVDLAVGVIIGAAFGKIVASFVGDVLMPPIGYLLGGIDFSNIAITLKSAMGGDPKTAVVIKIGAFINTVIDFLIVAFVIFLAIRVINRLHRPRTPEVTTKECPYCYSTIPLKATRCPYCTSELKGALG